MNKKDIFISYRRDGGKETAKHLFDLLSRDNYRVAFDIDTLRSGMFDENIYKIIDECTDFIVVLSKGSLERCTIEGDWVRLEIEYALQRKKNIIPIELSGFDRDKEFALLPEDIAKFKKCNTITAPIDYFDDFYRRLIRDWIKSPKFTPPPILPDTPKQDSNWGGCLVGIVIACIIAFVVYYQNCKDEEYNTQIVIEERAKKAQEEIEKNKMQKEIANNISGAFQTINDVYGSQGISFQLTNLNSYYSTGTIKFKIKNNNGDELFSRLIQGLTAGEEWDIGFCRYYQWQWEKGQIVEIVLSSGIIKTWTYK